MSLINIYKSKVNLNSCIFKLFNHIDFIYLPLISFLGAYLIHDSLEPHAQLHHHLQIGQYKLAHHLKNFYSMNIIQHYY